MLDFGLEIVLLVFLRLQRQIIIVYSLQRYSSINSENTGVWNSVIGYGNAEWYFDGWLWHMFQCATIVGEHQQDRSQAW